MLRHLPTAMCLALFACSSSSSTPPPPADSGTHRDAGGGGGMGDSGGTTSDTGTSMKDTGTTTSKDGGATMTIAQVRQMMPTGSFTVKGYVTALAGVPTDYPNWYIEDPAGGEYSGINVYCDPKATTPCNVTEPALGNVILLTGKLSPYMGQLEIEPTAMTVVEQNGTAPPVPMLTAADIAPMANSPYRGVYVNLVITAPTKLVVDNVKPTILADTGSSCGANFDASVPMCSTLCEGPVYSGFEANDGTGNEVYVQAPFFHTDPLQSSPECLTQQGVVPVMVGTTFSKMSGILDYALYAGVQTISPVTTSDYTTP